MNDSLQHLFELQSLELDQKVQPENQARIAALRTKIPQPMLSHYDRFAIRGKKGVALVRNQVCTGCHMRMPLGVVLELSRNGEPRLCDNCRRYLYLAKEAAPEVLVAPLKAPVKAGRKQLAHA